MKSWPKILRVSGIGKSGHIATKLAATFASTGTPAYFVHAAEAAHGDLGMITKDDVVIGISYSGESNELITIIPTIKREGAKLIAMTGNSESSLSRYSDVTINCYVKHEACPLNLAPSNSTTVIAVHCSDHTSRPSGNPHLAGQVCLPRWLSAAASRTRRSLRPLCSRARYGKPSLWR